MLWQRAIPWQGSQGPQVGVGRGLLRCTRFGVPLSPCRRRCRRRWTACWRARPAARRCSATAASRARTAGEHRGQLGQRGRAHASARSVCCTKTSPPCAPPLSATSQAASKPRHTLAGASLPAPPVPHGSALLRRNSPSPLAPALPCSELLRRGASNIPWVDCIPQHGLNVYSILQVPTVPRAACVCPCVALTSSATLACVRGTCSLRLLTLQPGVQRRLSIRPPRFGSTMASLMGLYPTPPPLAQRDYLLLTRRAADLLTERMRRPIKPCSPTP